MRGAEIWPAVISSAATVVFTGLMTIITRAILGVRKDLHQFMSEHLWLLAISGWSRGAIEELARRQGVDLPPPPDLTGRDSNGKR